MEFFEDGEEVITRWRPDERFQGYGSVLHGGIQATVMDELASWTVFVKLETAGVTSSLSVDYRRPVYTDRGALTIRASVDEVEKNMATIALRLYDSDGNLCSEGRVVYFTFPPKLAQKRLAYPGRKAFDE